MPKDCKYALLWGLFAFGLWFLLSWQLQPPFSAAYDEGRERIILDANNEPLAAIRHPQWRALEWREEVPPLLAAAALAAEDARFYQHFGVDFPALARAIKDNILAGRIVSGASTISMQLARQEQVYKNGQSGARSWQRKLREVARALWLESHYSKEQILSWYLNLAPFGGPLLGVSAGSRFLFDKIPERLSPAQAAALMAIPQDPNRLLRRPASLLARRDYILRRMAAMGALGEKELQTALAEPLELGAPPPPATLAPHFARYAAATPPLTAEISTYLNPQWQRRIDYMIKNLCRQNADLGMTQAAAVVLRNRDRAVMAWVGSRDFYEPHSGQVDGVTSLRQPGSALKPFIYALALEQGYWLAQPLADDPLLIAEEGAAFRPHDYDRRYHGQVSLRQALGSSLNIPALRLALSLSPASVLDYLRALNFPLYQNPSHYGPGLALGNGEVDLLTLTNAYATLAEGGLYKPVRRHKEQEESAPRRVLDPRAAYLIAHVLADDEARALGFGRHGVLQLPFAAAVKTGTSQHHRDNWCVGFSSEYTVGVWSGDFSGQPMQQVSGVSGAAPLWRQIMLMLHHQRPGSLPPVPPGISTAKVCLDSGLSAHAQCPRQGEELIMTPLAECGLHGAQNPNRPAPALWLDLPARNGVYILDPDVPAQFQALHCRLRGADDAPAVSWRLDGEPLAGDGQKNLRLPLRPGRHLLEVRQGEQSLRIPYLVR